MGKCSWQGSTDDDFERKLLMHCEAHAHEYDSIVDTTFDDDEEPDSFMCSDEDDDGSNASFTMIQIGGEDHNYSPSDVNVVSDDPTSDVNLVSVIQEEETGVEVVMQRYCVSCAMDVTDVMGKCPFCMAAKRFDLNFEDDSNSSSHGLCLDRSHSIEYDEDRDRKQLNAAPLTSSEPVLLTPSTPSIPADRRRVKVNQNGKKLLKGMIVGFLEENKNAQGQQRTKTSPNFESRNDTSLSPEPKTSATDDDAPTSLRELNVINERTDEFMLRSQRLHEVNKKLIRESNMLVEHCAYTATHGYELSDVDATVVRSQLMLLENHYSKQERRRRRQLKIYS